jgi:hypothetical protein
MEWIICDILMIGIARSLTLDGRSDQRTIAFVFIINWNLTFLFILHLIINICSRFLTFFEEFYFIRI